MTMNNEFEYLVGADNSAAKGSELQGMALDLYKEYDSIIKPKTMEKLSEREDCYINFGGERTGGEQQISKAQFKEKLGDQVAEFLNRIGCEKATLNGDHLKLTLDKAKTIPVDDNGIKDIKLGKDLDMNISRNGDEIRISDVKGVRINPKYYFESDLPDFKVTPKGVDVGSIIPYIPAPGAYSQLDELLNRFGK